MACLYSTLGFEASLRSLRRSAARGTWLGCRKCLPDRSPEHACLKTVFPLHGSHNVFGTRFRHPSSGSVDRGWLYATRMNRSAPSPQNRPDTPRRLTVCSEYISGRIGCIRGGGKALVFVFNRRATEC